MWDIKEMHKNDERMFFFSKILQDFINWLWEKCVFNIFIPYDLIYIIII